MEGRCLSQERRKEPNPYFFRESREKGDPLAPDISLVTRKTLVPAISGQDDFHILPRHLRHIIRWNRGRVGEGLVIMPDELGKNLESLGLNHEFMVVGCKLF